jgi:hypothetical protein
MTNLKIIALVLLVSFGFSFSGLARSSRLGLSRSHSSRSYKSVNGYFKRNGSYIAPHRRSNKDGRKFNNWSTKGNINPFTGKRGSK